MRSLVIFAAIVLFISSCKKDYVCVCTEKATGEKSYGDHFQANSLTKAAADESCKANDDVYASELEDCHLE